METYKVKAIVHCLTDLWTWHYIKIIKKGRSQIQVAWCHSITEQELQPQLEPQLEFVYEAVSSMIQ